MRSWSRFFLPLVLLSLLLGALVECRSHSTSVSTSNGPSENFGKGTEDNTFAGNDGRDLVESALQKLRELKISPAASSKPSGLVGYGLHYAKHAFYLLFMNGPPLEDQSDSDSQSYRLDPDLAKAVNELEVAATETQNPDAMFLLAEMNFYGNYSHPRNFKESFKWYHDLALSTGNSSAQYMIGFMYATGIGGAVERDQGMALLYHKFAAEQGNTRSEMTLAFRHHIGIGTHRNCDSATHYYKRVADKAIAYWRSGPPGGYNMPRQSFRWADDEGGVYGEGASVSSSGPNANRDSGQPSADASLEDIIEYLDLLSKKGNLKATLSLGKWHYDGSRNLPRNYRKAMKYFRAVAKRYWTKDGAIIANHPPEIEAAAAKAAGHIGLMYLRGEGVEQNFATAMAWFKRGLANGDPLCQHEIGLMYLHGYGVTQDAFKASGYFKAAAEQDFAAAETRLGALFLDQGDVQTATRYFELAARLGWMEAFYYLAEIANFGIGRERHCGMASAYYKMVAEKAEQVHSSFAEANKAYENDDHDTALIAVLMAAEQGYEHAQSNVAYLLDEQQSVISLGKILPWAKKRRSSLLRNTALALIYWTRSARQSNIDSLVKMGDYYLKGIGSSVDAEKASTCYHTAAEGHHSAQAYWNLGWMHENGVAVDQDFHMAKRYYDLALETNHEAYFPVKLSLMKLRLRHFWNRITNGKVNGIQDEKENRAPRTFKEWIIAFLENDEEEALYQAQLLREREENGDILGTHHPHRAENDDTGYYDELELDIDESVFEALIIVALAATLLILVYIRQRNRRDGENAGNGQQQAAGGQNGQGANVAANNDNNNDRGLFPRPDQPEFAQWAAGGVGH